jgi:glucose dehydrogenase
MQRQMTVSRAVGTLLAALFYNGGWRRVVLRIVWLVAAIAFLGAFFSSFSESEPRAAVLYGAIFLVLIVLGVWRSSRRRAA